MYGGLERACCRERPRIKPERVQLWSKFPGIRSTSEILPMMTSGSAAWNLGPEVVCVAEQALARMTTLVVTSFPQAENSGWTDTFAPVGVLGGDWQWAGATNPL